VEKSIVLVYEVRIGAIQDAVIIVLTHPGT